MLRNKYIYFIFFTIVILLIPFISPSFAVEEKVIKTVSLIDSIDIEGPFVLTVNNGSNSNLEITGEKELIPFIITKVESGTLFIRLTSDTPVHEDKPMKLNISLLNLVKLKAAGNTNVKINKIKNVSFEVRLSDTAQATISGKTNNLSIYASGKSKLDTENFTVNSKGKFLLIDLNGDVELKIKNINADYLKVNLDYLTTLELTGFAENLDLNSRSSGTFLGLKLKIKNANIKMDDCTEAEVNVISNLKALLMGASGLKYLGSPRLDTSLSGKSKLEKLFSQ
jgi:hypothetical protein